MKTENRSEETSIPVLVVEDDEGLNLLIVKNLRRIGLEAEGVHTGREAMARIQAGFQGLLLLDYLLPDIKARELVEKLAAEQVQIPFIIMTGHGDERIAVEMMKLGARDYLIKDAGFIETLPRVVKRTVAEIEKDEKLSRTEKKLWQLEWLLQESVAPLHPGEPSPYGDLTELNTSGLLLDLLGRPLLMEVAEDYLQLLGTSGAIYEKNGEYALGIFSSGWCRRLDQASRDLCGTDDNQEALASGKWLCHESCWTDASRVAIESGEPADIECRGGLRLYAVPVRAGKEIVGSMNFGYGTPPSDLETLGEISRAYTIPVDELRQLAAAYETRPPFIIEIAKKRLHTSAKLVGEIIERKQTERQLQFEKKLQAGSSEILNILNEPVELRESILQVIEKIREFSGLDAVAIRLKKGADFPYYQTDGFSRRFVEQESSLCASDEEGMLLRDEKGNPVLECMCGRVIHGETNPRQPFFTAKGSFWTNSTTDLLATTTEEERQARTRNRCHADGYESVALIPLRNGPETIGLLQLNDRRRGFFTLELVHFFEILSSSIATSLARRKAEHGLLEAEKQLRQAQKMEAIGRLAGGVAHDFNNMLSVITGYGELALASLNPVDPLYGDIEEIIKAGKRSADLTRQLLAFARKQTISPRVLNLNELLAGSQKMLGRLVGEDIDQQYVAGPELWNVLIDPSQFDQIIANLAVNARDAISGVGKITVETANMSIDETYCHLHQGFRPGDFVMLSVSDSGHGMDNEVLEHIFEPFYTTKKEGKGTGLGLSTVYGIVKQANGFINVYSEPEKGTTIRIYQPRVLDEAEAETPLSDREDLTGTETVLVVEDERQILELTKKILKKLGYTVLAAATPGEACVLAEKHDRPIDLLLTDVVMPNMNGKELQERIEQIKPGIRTLFMSGYTANVIVHRGVLPKGTQFIPKPFNRAALGRKIREVLDNQEPD